MSNVYKKIGENIQRLREAAGLTQEEFARLLGYTSPSTITYYEKGMRRIKLDEIIKIANIFHIDDYQELLPNDDSLIESDLTPEAVKFRAEQAELKNFNHSKLEEDFKSKSGFRKVEDNL